MFFLSENLAWVYGFPGSDIFPPLAVSIKSSIVKWLDIHLLIAHTHCFGSVRFMVRCGPARIKKIFFLPKL